jgi:hypothetical protein
VRQRVERYVVSLPDKMAWTWFRTACRRLRTASGLWKLSNNKKNDKRPVVQNCQTTNKRPTAKLQKIVRPLTTLVDNSDIPKPIMISEQITEAADVKKKEARERKTLKQRERRRCTKKRKRKAAWARAKYQKIKLNKAAIVQEAAKVKEATRSEVWPVLKMVKDVYCQLAVPSTMDIEITREVTNSITKLKLGDSGLNNETRDDDDTGVWPLRKMMEDVDGQQAVEISGEVTTTLVTGNSGIVSIW